MKKIVRIRKKSVPSTRKRKGRTGSSTLYLLVLIISLTAAPQVYSQEADDAVDMEDLGFYSHLLSAARPAALAGAYTSSCDDVHSLVYNPAGLARARRIEGSIGFQYEKNKLQNTYFGSAATVDQTSTNLDYISVAYPFPTYRGSLVGAFGIYREYSSYMDLLYRGFNTTTQSQDEYILQQTGSIFSYNVGFGVDLSPTLSAGASIFFMDGSINALTQWSYEYPPPLNPGDLQQEFLLDDLEADLDGYGGRVGIQFYPHNMVRFGISVTTPIWIYLDGNASTEITDYIEDQPDEFYVDFGSVDIDYRFPYRIDTGISLAAKHLLVSFDIGYADWSQSSINQTRLRDSSGSGIEPVQREVIDIRTGVEVNVPGTSFQVRLGYAYLPYALAYLETDRIGCDPDICPDPTFKEANIDKEHQMYAFGLGGLLGRVLTIDAAYQRIEGTRSVTTLKDERTQHRVLISSTYHF